MYNTKKQFIINTAFWGITFVIFILLTFPKMINHITGYDEAHAWIIANNINFSNFIDILKTEGHPIGWYLLIIPFAKSNINYPYPMYILNYCFCFLSLIILWFKFPFNKIIKFFIIIAPIFTSFYAIVARNYSIGILLLFLVASMYKNQEKHPFKYAVCIALAIHTHILCTIGAVGLFFIFIYKFLNKKNVENLSNTIYFAIFIVLFSIIVFIFPYLGEFSNSQNLYYSPPGLTSVSNYFTTNFYGLNLILYSLASVCILKLSKDIFAHFFYLFTALIMLILFGCFYGGTAHHFFMFYIYLIITLWIMDDNYKFQDNFWFLTILAVLLLLPVNKAIDYIYPKNNIAHIRAFINSFNINEKYDGKVVFIDEYSRQIAPYLKSNIKLYDICTAKKYDWTIYTEPCSLSLNEITNEQIKQYANYDEIYVIFNDEFFNIYQLTYNDLVKLYEFIKYYH